MLNYQNFMLIFWMCYKFHISRYDHKKAAIGDSIGGSSTRSSSGALHDGPFKAKLVFLGKKQNSRDGIKRYRSIQNPETPQYIEQFSTLTEAFLTCQNLANFEHLIFEHEKLIASVLDLPRAKDLHFSDYWGEIKSLGAWGGDFVLATSDRNLDETKNYFNQHGFQTILRYSEMVL